MAVPLSQMLTVTSYVFSQKLKGVKRYPLVLMLEPLFRCESGPVPVVERSNIPNTSWTGG